VNLLESSWFLISSLIIAIVLLVDPASSTGSNNNAVLGLFSSAGSGQQFVYNFGVVLILLFFVLTIILSLSN
jgi:preprotein translocase subunit SecG